MRHRLVNTGLGTPAGCCSQFQSLGEHRFQPIITPDLGSDCIDMYWDQTYVLHPGAIALPIGLQLPPSSLQVTTLCLS